MLTLWKASYDFEDFESEEIQSEAIASDPDLVEQIESESFAFAYYRSTTFL